MSLEEKYQKSASIILVISALMPYLEKELITIEDYWDADLCAIGFRKNNILIYVSCHPVVKDMQYYMDVDLIDDEKPDAYNIIDKKEGLYLPELIAEIKKWFELT